MKPTLRTLACLLLAAAPALAGPVYVPVALNYTSGAYTRSTDIWVTNPDTAVQGFVVRYLQSLSDGTTRTDGDEIGPFYLLPGQTFRYNNLVPANFRGMLELDGFPGLQFSAALTVETQQGVKVQESEIPVLSQANLIPANGAAVLQGLEKIGLTITSNLGVVNMGHSPALCRVGLRQRDGLLIIQNVPVNLPPLSMLQYEDAFTILGLSIVPEGARADITCDQPFWTYYSTYNDVSGAVEVVEPSTSILSSTLVEPSGDTGGGGGGNPPPPPAPGDAVVFESNGEIVRYPTSRWALNNYRINMPFSGSRTFSKLTVDFDFHIGNWDNQRPTGFHCIFWLNNGSSWNNMFGYVNTRGTRSQTVFQVNATGGGWQETTQSGSPQPGGNYHMHYEYDTNTHEVFYEIRTAGGSRVVGRAYGLANGVRDFTTSRFFIEFGAQHADEGPEAYTPGWSFSNLRAVFIP
ncbi:MAG: hypothetical protein AB7G12_16115 [Thermoanaerobaculia bacterium]